VGQHIAKKIIGYQIRINPAELAGKQAVRLLQDSRCAALRALMFDNKFNNNLLQFFTAFVAVRGFRDILVAAGGAGFGFDHLCHCRAAA
jgi:hypothetical protein